MGPMNRHEMEQLSLAVLRSSIGWQTAIARRLGVSPRSVRRWLVLDSVPNAKAARLRELAENAGAAWPEDEWLMAFGFSQPHQRPYIIHVQPPRFVARIMMHGPEEKRIAEEMIWWMDEIPHQERRKWMQEAERKIAAAAPCDDHGSGRGIDASLPD